MRLLDGRTRGAPDARRACCCTACTLKPSASRREADADSNALLQDAQLQTFNIASQTALMAILQKL